MSKSHLRLIVVRPLEKRRSVCFAHFNLNGLYVQESPCAAFYTARMRLDFPDGSIALHVVQGSWLRTSLV